MMMRRPHATLLLSALLAAVPSLARSQPQAAAGVEAAPLKDVQATETMAAGHDTLLVFRLGAGAGVDLRFASPACGHAGDFARASVLGPTGPICAAGSPLQPGSSTGLSGSCFSRCENFRQGRLFCVVCCTCCPLLTELDCQCAGDCIEI